MARIGRPRTCNCGECRKCKQRVAAKARYDGMTKAQRRAWRNRRDPVRVRRVDRERSGQPQRVALRTSVTRRWREEHPERVRAHSAVARALRAGTLVKGPCEECDSKDVHAHHDDYSKPLEVRWLCPLHHGATRKEAAR